MRHALRAPRNAAVRVPMTAAIVYSGPALDGICKGQTLSRSVPSLVSLGMRGDGSCVTQVYTWSPSEQGWRANGQPRGKAH